MIKVENVEIFNFEGAVRGMRNPLNSWDKSDSAYCNGEQLNNCGNCYLFEDDKNGGTPICHDNEDTLAFVIGDADMALMQKLYKAGTEHRKYLRQIFVSMDITAPLYWWKEYDTYKVGTVANSCSTMHKIHANEFTLDDFSHDHLDDCSLEILKNTIDCLNGLRNTYVKYEKLSKTFDCDVDIKLAKKSTWYQMIQLLPSSYNQRRTVTINYENVVSIIKQRENHKLDEWRAFVKLLKQFPYIKQIMGIA